MSQPNLNSSPKALLAMCASMLALSVAVNVHADDSSVSASAQEAPPDRAAVEAAMKKCASENGVTREMRPTEEQHEAIAACMKAAGFERPPGGPGRLGPRGDHHRPLPGPPPDDAQPIRTGGSSVQ